MPTSSGDPSASAATLARQRTVHAQITAELEVPAEVPRKVTDAIHRELVGAAANETLVRLRVRRRVLPRPRIDYLHIDFTVEADENEEATALFELCLAQGMADWDACPKELSLNALAITWLFGYRRGANTAAGAPDLEAA